MKRGTRAKPLILPSNVAPPPAPSPPSDLGPEGRRWWLAIWEGGRRWLDPSTDVLLVEMVCRNQDRIVDVEAVISLEGRYYKTPAGQLLPHPALADARALSAQSASWLSALCFTPADRRTLGIVVAGSDTDALAAFRDRKKIASGNVGTYVAAEPQDATPGSGAAPGIERAEPPSEA